QSASIPSRQVTITQSGRGGSIVYDEDGRSVPFDWEFALPPTLALIWGPQASTWDADYPWAVGRQREVYEFVGSEVVRQKTLGAHFTFDLEAGTLEIITQDSVAEQRDQAKPRRAASSAYARFLESVVPIWRQWGPDETYDVSAIARLNAKESAQ